MYIMCSSALLLKMHHNLLFSWLSTLVFYICWPTKLVANAIRHTIRWFMGWRRCRKGQAEAQWSKSKKKGGRATTPPASFLREAFGFEICRYRPPALPHLARPTGGSVLFLDKAPTLACMAPHTRTFRSISLCGAAASSTSLAFEGRQTTFLRARYIRRFAAPSSSMKGAAQRPDVNSFDRQ